MQQLCTLGSSISRVIIEGDVVTLCFDIGDPDGGPLRIDVVRGDFERFLTLCKAAFANPSKTVTPSDLKLGFADFWDIYPRKTAKADAQRAWMRHQCYRHIEVILGAVVACKSTSDWNKDGGKFIPHPSTWINGRRWEDGQEIEDATAGAR